MTKLRKRLEALERAVGNSVSNKWDLRWERAEVISKRTGQNIVASLCDAIEELELPLTIAEIDEINGTYCPEYTCDPAELKGFVLPGERTKFDIS